jgi:hypothetical protein
MQSSPKTAIHIEVRRCAPVSVRHRLLLLVSLLCLAPYTAISAKSTVVPTTALAGALPIRHVFDIVLENEPYQVTFGKQSQTPYLAHTLSLQGATLPNYYGIGHSSLDNYVAMISGQAPNLATQDDCKIYSEFQRTSPGLDANGQALGSGCIYPTEVKTLADQLDAIGLSWKGYMEDMGADPSRESAACGRLTIGASDFTHFASATDQYATKHNPFVYFHSIIDDTARCAHGVVNLQGLAQDLQHIDSTPNFAFITPNLCHDGHDAPCKNGEPGGLVSADAFLRSWVPRILASPAFRKDGLLVITFDEGTDGTACCGEHGLPQGPMPGKFGPGGGQTGAVLLSPFIAPGTVSTVPYNHYSLLRSVEDVFGLTHLGYAGAPQLRRFGADVFTAARSMTGVGFARRSTGP